MLTDALIRNAKPTDKPRRLHDGAGLYLEVAPAGGKWWRFKYRRSGKDTRISLGTYPTVSLKEARARRNHARKLLSDGIDPSAARRAQKSAQADTFEAVAREWHAKQAPTWKPGHAETVMTRLEQDVFPWLRDRPTSEVTAPELLTVLRRIEARGAIELAHRAHNYAGRIFRYAIATGRAERDPAADLRGALTPVKEKHHPTITDPQAIGALLRAIDGYRGSFVVRCALRLAPLTFVRMGELRMAEWREVSASDSVKVVYEWRIPAERMKIGTMHIVPLSVQASNVLADLQPLTGTGRYLFPGLRTPTRPMSENTINAALRRLGYSKEEMTGHGFRSMASTLLHEQGWNHKVIERQLAHCERDAVSAAYNYAEHLPERRRMMQAWADYLDSLKMA